MDNIKPHVAALQARVPEIAVRMFDLLRCPAWSGWKPTDIGEVQSTLRMLLGHIERGATGIATGGLHVTVGEDESGTPTVRVAFEAEFFTSVDPFEGTIAVVGL